MHVYLQSGMKYHVKVVCLLMLEVAIVLQIRPSNCIGALQVVQT